MVDKFKNFLISGTEQGEYTLIPVANGVGRDLAATEEIHDLMFASSSRESSLNDNWKANIDVYIKDISNNSYFLYSYIILKDGDTWHNEKAISLKYNQSLVYKIRNNISNGIVSASASCMQYEDKNAEFCTLTIKTNPSNASVLITAGGISTRSKTLKVPKGTTVTYTVSAPYYVTTTRSKVVNSNETINVQLEKLYYVRINTNVEDVTANITLTASGYTQEGDLIYVQKGTTVTYTVTAPHYKQKTGSVEISASNPKNITKLVELELEEYTLTINPDPSTADVTLTATGYSQIGKSIKVKYGTPVSWKVTRQSFKSKSGTYTVKSNYTMNVTLDLPVNTVLFESSTPGTYSLPIDRTGTYSIIMVGAGGGGAAQGDKYAYKSSSAGGASGSFVNTEYILNANTTYTLKVGKGGDSGLNKPGYEHYNKNKGPGWCPTNEWLIGGDGSESSLNNLIVCNGGTGGKVMFTNRSPRQEEGVGGVCTISGYKKLIKKLNGNNGKTTVSIISTPAAGGASVYNGYGAGGSAQATGHNNATANEGANGYIKIVYIGAA